MDESYTWQTKSQGGSVGTRCKGSTVSMAYAAPAEGYTADVQKTGPDAVRVVFSAKNHVSEITVTCTSEGQPYYSIVERDR